MVQFLLPEAAVVMQPEPIILYLQFIKLLRPDPIKSNPTISRDSCNDDYVCMYTHPHPHLHPHPHPHMLAYIQTYLSYIYMINITLGHL